MNGDEDNDDDGVVRLFEDEAEGEEDGGDEEGGEGEGEEGGEGSRTV